MDDVKNRIRTIPDYPRTGVQFRDITSLLADAQGFRTTINRLVDRHTGTDIDKVAAIEARGFILGAAIAHQLGVGFVPVRKKGKLPGTVHAEDYSLEYGTDTIEVHTDAIIAGEKVLLVDDLIATGGTALAAAKLIEKCSGVIVECVFVVDLPDLGGRGRLEDAGYPVHTLVAFEGD